MKNFSFLRKFVTKIYKNQKQIRYLGFHTISFGAKETVRQRKHVRVLRPVKHMHVFLTTSFQLVSLAMQEIKFNNHLKRIKQKAVGQAVPDIPAESGKYVLIVNLNKKSVRFLFLLLNFSFSLFHATCKEKEKWKIQNKNNILK